MSLNFWAIIVCAIVSMIIGSVWYGVIFKNAWMKIIGVEHNTPEENKRMQRIMMPLYAIQFLLSLLQVYVLAGINRGLPLSGSLHNSIVVWFGFIIPILAGNVMWTTKTPKQMWKQFLIQAGYQLVLFVAFGLILGAWH